MRISACRLCGVPIEQGMRYFTVIEMFMGLVHLKHIVETVVELNFVVMNDAMGMVNDVAYKQNCLNGLLLFIDILRGAFCACLIVQIFSSFFLYFVGYRKRNIPFCLIWILVSANTLIVSLFLLISTLCEIPSKGTESDPMFWKTQLLICGRHPSYGVTIAVYELYLIFGICVVLEFVSGGGGPAIHTVTPVWKVPEVPSVSEKPSENV